MDGLFRDSRQKSNAIAHVATELVCWPDAPFRVMHGDYATFELLLATARKLRLKYDDLAFLDS